MKECFLITSYCDTEQKITKLKDTIENIKQFDIDIAIHAHYPLNKDIQNSVNHYIYSENFIIDNTSKVSFFWIEFENYKLWNYKTNYNYTVLKQYGESVNYLFSVCYDVIHFLNYDSNIVTELYSKSKEFCDKQSVFYQNLFTKDNSVTSIWFSLNKKDKDSFLKITSYDEYVKSDDYSIEKYIGSQVDKLDVKFIELGNYNNKILYKNEISFDGVDYEEIYENRKKSVASINFDTFFKKEDYFIFGGSFNKKFGILFYDVKSELDIKIKIKNKKYNLTIGEGMVFIDTGLSVDDIHFKEVDIKINEHYIDNVLIDRFLKNKIELINNDKW